MLFDRVESYSREAVSLSNEEMKEEEKWSSQFRDWLSVQQEGDPAHDLQHIERVVLNTRHLAGEEGLGLEVLLPAAWLHDCVHVAKDSPNRSKASVMAADRAVEYLRVLLKRYPEHTLATDAQALLDLISVSETGELQTVRDWLNNE